MKRALLFAVALIIAAAIGFAIADYYDPEPVETPTKTCEPIGAQHPKTASAECARP